MSAHSTLRQPPLMPPPWRSPLIVLVIGLAAWWLLPDQLGLAT